MAKDIAKKNNLEKARDFFNKIRDKIFKKPKESRAEAPPAVASDNVSNKQNYPVFESIADIIAAEKGGEVTKKELHSKSETVYASIVNTKDLPSLPSSRLTRHDAKKPTPKEPIYTEVSTGAKTTEQPIYEEIKSPSNSATHNNARSSKSETVYASIVNTKDLPSPPSSRLTRHDAKKPIPKEPIYEIVGKEPIYAELDFASKNFQSPPPPPSTAKLTTLLSKNTPDSQKSATDNVRKSLMSPSITSPTYHASRSRQVITNRASAER